MSRRCPQPLSARVRKALQKLALVFFLFAGLPNAVTSGQTLNFNRDRGRIMLNTIKEDVRKNYFDPSLRGIDLDAHFKEAEEKIKRSDSLNQILGVIAQTLLDFNDSHTFFVPPSRPARVEYGWQMLMVGDKCFVTAVRPGSDAEAKGLKPGDEVKSIDGYAPTREIIWKLKYFYYSLRPRYGMRLVIIKPDGKEQELGVHASVDESPRVKDVGRDYRDLRREAESERRLHRNRWVKASEDLMIWKMPEFTMTDESLDEMLGKVRNHKALILDLRGNPGGLVDNLERLSGYFFDHDINIAEVKGRKEQKRLHAKTRGNRVFKGQLAVLVDSESASAAELFARLMQLEKRGVVLGDRTAGAVMMSRSYGHEQGLEVVALYGASITVADLIMSDGKSLEKVGVTPDELLLPTPQMMAAQHDPVISKAAALLGYKLDPVQAGAFFPTEWRK